MMLEFLGEADAAARSARHVPNPDCPGRQPRSATSSQKGSEMPITPTEKIWMNGEMVDWADAKIHILTHTLHYGMGVFEGMRAYETDGGPASSASPTTSAPVRDSARILGMTCRTRSTRSSRRRRRSCGRRPPRCYVRPIAYYGYGEMGLSTKPCRVDVPIACWPWGAYLGDDAVTKGVRMKISSWMRHDHNTMPPAAKTTGNYVNSSLAKVEALKAGYDEAIMLNPQGLVPSAQARTSSSARHGAIITPAAVSRARSRASPRAAS